MNPFALLAALALTTQVKTVVMHGESAPVVYNANQTQDVPIALPTDRYVCTRNALLHIDNQVGVIVACKERGHAAFAVGVACHLDREDSSETLLSIDASKGTVPNVVTIVIGCKTEPRVSEGNTFL